VVTSEKDQPEFWVRAGQVYERLALSMTRLKIKSSLLNQPVEIPSLRLQFQSALNLNGSLPQLVIRYGYADSMPYSYRRSVEEVVQILS
jgi:hypothetical protein